MSNEDSPNRKLETDFATVEVDDDVKYAGDWHDSCFSRDGEV